MTGTVLPYEKPTPSVCQPEDTVRVDFSENEGGYSEWYVNPADLELLSEPTVTVAAHPLFPANSAERKKIPVASGVLDYFPSALVEVAKISFAGNEQHNPGEPLHWAREKSTDQDDTIIRHFLERGKLDIDGQRHSAKLAWRALALLQLELEAEGYPKARGAK
jgi:hypothetical protein